MEIKLETTLKVNHVEIDQYTSFFDIEVESPFFNDRTCGLVSPDKLINFLESPTLKNLNILQYDRHEEFVLINKKTLKELQNGKKTLKNLFINIENPLKILNIREKQTEINIKETENIFFFNENTCEKLRTGEYTIIKVDYSDKVILDINNNCLYFTPIYQLPFSDFSDVDMIKNAQVGKWPPMSATFANLNEVYEKGYLEKNNYSLDLKQKFKYLKMKEIKKSDHEQFNIDSFNCFLNNSNEDYNTAWQLAKSVTNKSGYIDFAKVATLFLLKMKGIDEASGFNTSIFWESVNVEAAEYFQKVWLKYNLEKDLVMNSISKKHKI